MGKTQCEENDVLRGIYYSLYIYYYENENEK